MPSPSASISLPISAPSADPAEWGSAGGQTRPCWQAATTAWTRSRRSSLVSRRETWVFTVASLTTSRAAISVLAQLVGDEPEPRVARWADVKDFTVDYYEADEVTSRFNGFSLTHSTGMWLPGLSGQAHRRERRDLVAEAEHRLAPRLVPALTEA